MERMIRMTFKKTKPRPVTVDGMTWKINTGCGNIYVTINHQDSQVFEIFAQIGKTGGCAASQTEAIGRLAALSLRSGVDPEKIVKQLSNICCMSPGFSDGQKVVSCADAIGKALKKTLAKLAPPIEAEKEEKP